MCFIYAAISINTCIQPPKAGALIPLSRNGKTVRLTNLPKVTQSEDGELRFENVEVCLISGTAGLGPGLFRACLLSVWASGRGTIGPACWLSSRLGREPQWVQGLLQRRLENPGPGERAGSRVTRHSSLKPFHVPGQDLREVMGCLAAPG